METTAPEALEQSIFSEQSDVFSFGILLILLFNVSKDKIDEINQIRTDKRSLKSVGKPKYAGEDEKTSVL